MSAERRDGVIYVTAKNVVIRVGTDLSQAADKPPLSVSKGGTFTFQGNHDGDLLQAGGILISSNTDDILFTGTED